MTTHKKVFILNPLNCAVSLALCVSLTACTPSVTGNVGADAPTNASSPNTPNDSASINMAEQPTPAILMASDIAQTVNASNQFAIDMLQQLNQTNDDENTHKNIFYSPYSLSTAMAMLYNTADGTTKSQMQQTFHFPELYILNASNKALYDQFNTQKGGERNYVLTTVNDLWVQQGLQPLPRFVDTVQTYYGAKVTNLDFERQPEAARVTINNHIADATDQMIAELLPQNSITPEITSVLTNAIYFKGMWDKPFGTSYEPMPFKLFDGSHANITMVQGTKEVNHYQNDSVDMIEIPYRDDTISMVMILPKDASANAMDALVNNLSATQLDDWIANAKPTTMDLTFPKFKLSTGYKMNEILSDMGMPKAFTNASELTLFANAGNHKIDGVYHKAVIEVDEKGTKAAAATGITVTPVSAVYYPEFTADHPFVFMIRDTTEGAILFMGQVNNPQ